MHSEGLNYFMLTNQSMPIFAEKLVFFTKQYLGLVMLFLQHMCRRHPLLNFFAISMAFIMISVAVLAYEPISHECVDG